MLTPLDIENKKFQKQMMNGYNVDEVDDFLDEITVDYEKLYKENTELRAEIEKSKSDLERYKNIEQTLQNEMNREIPSDQIGEMVMDRLKEVDEVAYVRFASVYRQFKDISTFMAELSKLLQEK